MKDKPLFDTWKRIRELRETLGLNQRFVADYMGIDNSKYNKIELGNQHIRLEELIAFKDLAAEYGHNLNLESLITGENYKPVKQGRWRKLKKIS